MSTRKTAEPQGQPSTARRALLTGGAVGLAAVAGSALGRTQPAFAQTGVQPTPDWINVTASAYGAQGDGTTNDTAAIRAAIAAVPASGGVVYFPAGEYLIQSTVTIEIGNSGQGPIYLVGDGRDVSTLLYNGTNACIHMYNPNAPGTGFPGITTWGGGVLGLTIDGSGCSPSNVAYGLHIGDGEEYQLDLKIQHFNVSGSIGLYIDNTVWWVGRMHAKAQLLDCDSAVIFDFASSSPRGNNFGYSDWDFDIFNNVGQNGVVIQNGATPYNSILRIKGEWEQSTNTNGGVALTVTGTDANSNPSTLTNCELVIRAELNGNTFTGLPQTISLGSGNKIKVCYGSLVFIGQSGQNWLSATSGSSTYVQGGQQLGFYGAIIGDTTLGPTSEQGNTSPLQLSGAPVVYAPGNVSGSTVSIGNGDFFATALTANTTLAWGSQNGQKGPQRKTFVITQGSGGYSLGWPSSGSPSVTSPDVVWPGGASAPAMPSASGAVAVFRLESNDGATWYGDVPLVLDASASDIKPDGIAAAGSNGVAADSGHIHQNWAMQSLYVAPSAATAETFPRLHVGGATSTLTSGTLYVVAIGLPRNLTVSNLTFCTAGAAAASVSDGWYVLLDSGRNVVAVTANQTSGWGTANTPVTLPVATSYTTTSGGHYYMGVMVRASTMPAFAVSAGSSGLPAGLVSSAPILCGSSSTGQTTPPSVGATMSTFTANGGFAMYAYTS